MGLTLGAVLRATVVAGLVAGLVAAFFHLVITEPVIEQAIAIEEQLGEAGGAHEAPLVSRDAQRVGLVIGFLLYGLVWALLFGVVYHAGGQRWLPAWSASRQGLLLALVGYWSVGLFPFLKYPANPPGVGEPETIAYRQSLYLGFLALSVAGTALAIALGRSIGRARPSTEPWLPVLALAAVFAAILYLVLPGNPDPDRLSPELVLRFRLLSLAGLTLFWAGLGLVFALRVRPGSFRKGGWSGRPYYAQ